MKLCECGCGQEVKRRFVLGHSGFKKGKSPWNKNLKGDEYKKHYPNSMGVPKGSIPWNKKGEGKKKSSQKIKEKWSNPDSKYNKRKKYFGKNNPNYGNGDKIRGKNNPMYGKPSAKGSSRGKGGIRKDIGHYVRSRWEANFARFLQFMDIDYEYEPRAFELSNGTTYTPDFYIKKQDMFIEIKGWMTDMAQEKIDLFQKEYSKYKFGILGVNEYTKFKDVFHVFKIKGWERK